MSTTARTAGQSSNRLTISANGGYWMEDMSVRTPDRLLCMVGYPVNWFDLEDLIAKHSDVVDHRSAETRAKMELAAIEQLQAGASPKMRASPRGQQFTARANTIRAALARSGAL